MAYQHAYIRDIYFPSDYSETTTTNIDVKIYLKYLLPYSTTLVIYDDPSAAITKGYNVKIFYPGDVYLESELTDFEEESLTYNEGTIKDYIKRNIFTRILIDDSTTTTTTTGTTVNINDYIVTTEASIFTISFDGGIYTPLTYNGYWAKDGFMYVDCSQLVGESIERWTNKIDPNNNTVTTATYLNEGNYVGWTNTIVASPSSGSYTYKIAQPVESNQLYLLSDNPFWGSVPNATLLDLQDGSGLINLMIDANDIMYLLTTSACYKIDARGETILMTQLFTFTEAGPFKMGIFNIYSNTIYIYSADYIMEFDLTGTVLNTYTLGLGGAAESFCISYDIISIIQTHDGPNSLNNFKLSDIAAGSSQVLTDNMVDGGPGVAKTYDLYQANPLPTNNPYDYRFILPYDIRNTAWDANPDIFFLDYKLFLD